jgi:hypothetical protein
VKEKAGDDDVDDGGSSKAFSSRRWSKRYSPTSPALERL